MLEPEIRQFIFIHIYKNAGTSITKALDSFAPGKWHRQACRVLKRLHIISPRFAPLPFPGHVKASELIRAIGTEAFQSRFSFAIVRNPWDWQVSSYKYILKHPRHFQHKLVKSLGNFDEFSKWRCAEDVHLQKDFIYSKEGELLVDFVGRFETIDADFKTICSRIGVEASLPMRNVSNTKPYQEYYHNEATKDLVRRTYDADITILGYDF